MNNVSSTPSASTNISVWFSSIPIVTRSVIVACVAIQLFGYLFGTFTGTVCHQTLRIIESQEVWRLFTGAWFHGGLLHLLLNMITFQAIAPQLERNMGSLSFIYNILLFSALGSCIHAMLAYALYTTNIYPSFMYECTVGLSGVIFSLLVINTNNQESQTRSLFGFFNVPTKLYPWALLIVLQIIMPGVSFMGHLSGILVGFLYSYKYLDLLQLPPWMLNSIESSRFMGWVISKDGYISNPSLGLTTHSPPAVSPLGILPIFRTTPAPQTPFGGTGHVLGTSNS